MIILVLPAWRLCVFDVCLLSTESLKPCVSSSDGHCFLSTQALLQRRRTFRRGLEQVTRQHHKVGGCQEAVEDGALTDTVCCTGVPDADGH